MKRHMLSLLATISLSLAVAGGLRAADEGQADLDQALEKKLSAQSLGDYGEVIRLTQAALDAGLDDQNKPLAEQLLASTLTERAALVCRVIFEAQQPDPRWPQLRRLALADLERSLETDDKAALTHFLIARLHALPGGDKKRALEAVEKAIELDSENEVVLSKALVVRGNLTDDDKKRQADYDRAIKLDGDDAEAYRTRGLFHLTQQQYDKALADLDKVIELEPDDPSAHEARGLVLFFQKKYDQARNSFDAAIKLDPDSRMAYVHRARCKAIAGDNKDAIKDVDEALRTDPANLPALLLRSQLLQQTKDLDGALADVDKVLALRPDLVEAMLMRASIFAQQKKLDEATAELERIRKAAPDDTEILLQLGTFYTAQKQSAKAIEVFDEVLGKEPKSADALRGRGDAHLNLGQQAEAIRDYEAALKLDEKDSGVLNNLAWVLATSPDEKLRDGPRAIELATRACEATDYKAAHILSTLAAGYAESGDFDKAVEWSTKAVDLDAKEHQEQLEKELQSYHEKKPWRERLREGEQPDDKASKDGDSGARLSNREAARK